MDDMVDADHNAWARSRRRYRQATQGRGAVVVGVVAAVVFPLVGVMIGIVLLFGRRPGPGLGCILLSVLAGAVYYVFGP